MQNGTFSEAVRNIVPKIPRGRVSTYGRIASLVGSPRAAQSVANAMGSPGCTQGWHRVVTSRGEVSPRLPEQYRKRQRELLAAERVKFDGWRIVGFAACLWDGLQGMEVLAFDTGTTIVGVLDLNTGIYTPYRKHGEPPWTKGAERVIECDGIVVSFNGNRVRLAPLGRDHRSGVGGQTSVEGRPLRHESDRLERSLATRSGHRADMGQRLTLTYKHYFPDDDVPVPPASITDPYEQDNWRDCWLAATLWKKLCGKTPA